MAPEGRSIAPKWHWRTFVAFRQTQRPRKASGVPRLLANLKYQERATIYLENGYTSDSAGTRRRLFHVHTMPRNRAYSPGEKRFSGSGRIG